MTTQPTPRPTCSTQVLLKCRKLFKQSALQQQFCTNVCPFQKDAPVMNYSHITDEQYEAHRQACLDVQFLILKTRGAVCKSNVEDYMIEHFGMDRYYWHNMLNSFEYHNIQQWVWSGEQTYWNHAFMMRPEPKLANYPGIAA